MLGGIAVVASIPAAAGILGYGIVKGIRKICEENELSCEEVDDRYEIRRKEVSTKENKNSETTDKEN
jgi:hypothetical protein